jgi:L-ascorbate metabolism protein UlaG (beta-lactamase superfamily)
MRVAAGTIAAGALVALLVATTPMEAAQEGRAMAMLAQDPACTTPKVASAGGPLPKGSNTVVLRWLGVSNYELSYRDQVILFDTFYSRVWPARPLGVMPSEFKRANAAFFGHGHWDHIADAPEIAKQTSAKMYGGPPTTEWLEKEGVAKAQLVTWKGGESEKFNGFTVQAIHARHAGGRPDPVNKLMTLYEELIPQFYSRDQSADEKAEMQRLRRRGAGGPRISSEGTLTYLVTFENGYRIAYADTAGSVTDAQKAVFAKIPRTDIGIVAYTGRFNTTLQNQESMPMVEAFKPRLVLPSHHEDETGIGAHFDMPVYPLGIAVRDKFPDAQTIAPLYLSALCVDTKSKEFFVGR